MGFGSAAARWLTWPASLARSMPGLVLNQTMLVFNFGWIAAAFGREPSWLSVMMTASSGDSVSCEACALTVSGVPAIVMVSWSPSLMPMVLM